MRAQRQPAPARARILGSRKGPFVAHGDRPTYSSDERLP